MNDIEEIEQEQTDYSLFLNKKNLSIVPKLIKGQLNEIKNDLEKQENILISLENLKNVISESPVVSSRNLSKAKWDYSLNLAIVFVKHGNLFETMGKVINGKLSLLPEETLFLIEKGSLILFEENDNGEEYPLSTQQAYSIIFSIPTFIFENYRVYSYLKRLGYIILEHNNIMPEINIGKSLSNNMEITTLNKDNDESFLKYNLTRFINYITNIERQIENLTLFSPSLQNILKKSFHYLDKLLFVPFSIAFNLETITKVNYFQNQKGETQPLYNYYDINTLEEVYSKISIISYYNSKFCNKNIPANGSYNNTKSSNSVIINYDVYKPNGQYSKKKKSLPDFYLIVQSCLNEFPHYMDLMSIIEERNKHCSILNDSNSNNKKIKQNNRSATIEIKLAMVNAANITFSDIDNEYIRSLRK